MWMMGIANSYTMEASFAGSSIGNRIDTHFNIQDYEQMGKSFCQTLLDYYDEDPRKERLRTKIIERLTKEGSNADEPTNIPLSDYSSDEGDTCSSSDQEEEKEIPEMVPGPPPPSPVIVVKKTKSKSSQSKAKLVLTKTSSAPRKPLPICKATLKLSLSEKENLESSSDSEREFDKLTIENIEKVSLFRRKRRKKRGSRKKCQMPIHEYSDSEIQVRKTLSQRSVSVFDLIPTDEIGTDIIAAQSSRTPPLPRVSNGRKTEVTRQLAEVQAKLYTLKNKFWFGVNGDVPFSWISESIFTSRTSSQKVSRKVSKKKKKLTKADKYSNKETKLNNEDNKTPNGLKRQSAIDWSIAVEPLKLGRSRSLPDDASIKKNIPNKINKEEKQEKKKKKRSRRFAKKVKVISNAKSFTQKL